MDFKFSIGDFVTTLEADATQRVFDSKRNESDKLLDVSLNRMTMSLVMTVVGRRLDECAGGTQILYLCRYPARDGYTEHWFNEIELMVHPDVEKRVMEEQT